MVARLAPEIVFSLTVFSVLVWKLPDVAVPPPVPEVFSSTTSRVPPQLGVVPPINCVPAAPMASRVQDDAPR